MKIIWLITYNLFFLPLIFLIDIGLSIFKRKVREALLCRIGEVKKTKNFFSNIENNKLIYWFHSASHGEFEQISPILHSLKEIQRTCIVVVSFSSPSGYKNVNDQNIDLKIYLPLDFLHLGCPFFQVLNFFPNLDAGSTCSHSILFALLVFL